MDRLNPFSVGLATALTFVVLNTLCAAVVALWPDATITVFNSFAHGLDSEPSNPQSQWASANSRSA